MIIIWQRWGILVLPFVGLGVLLGFGLSSLIAPGVRTGSQIPICIGIGLMLAGVALYFVSRAVIGKVIDKPKQLIVHQPLAEPVRLENGALQTHRAVPVTHPETGQPLWTQPKSTLFFIPVKYWSFIVAGIGALLFVVNLFVLLATNR